ncbi:unnamed protein product [Adineta steineri]|uniref:Uncharacterized protein n=1 Tax=Adineta steineri TaxID=433720 RepID=A0A819TQX2_9BILA|nr:unnamed protein product [Adineta steineri]CAF4091546.1 unnamed protein product [Adineta steineri]
MSTSKVNPNNQHRDVQQRNHSSKRTMINNIDPLLDNYNNNATAAAVTDTVLQQSRIHHITRSVKQKDKCENTNISPSKPESGSEEIYTTPLNNEHTKLSSCIHQKQRIRQRIGDYIGQDADEESTAICTNMKRNKESNEYIHRLSTSINNSANHLQQQGMGDHYHTNSKQQRNRSKTTTTPAALNRKYHRLIEQDDLEIALNERNAYQWRIIMYILILLILAFVIYRFLLALWPKPKQTLLKQLVHDLSTFFTP